MKALVPLVILAFGLLVDCDDWNDFKVKYKKSYLSQKEEQERKIVWGENSKFIELHNLEADQGLHTFRVGMNEFGDMTAKEFADMIKSRSSVGSRLTGKSRQAESTIKQRDIPEIIDWRASGCVAPVRTMSEGCNDEYAFGVAESIAGSKCALDRHFERLSTQQIIDCSRSFGNMGCEGGFYDQTYRYIIKTGGLETEKDYPNTEHDDQCHFNPAQVAAKIKDFGEVKNANETELMWAIATIGPVPVAVDASQASFQFYMSGVYFEPACSSQNVDHLMLAVGYGITPKPPIQFYIVKNSWGTTWGEDGYIRMSRYRDNNCGIASFASYPIL